MIIQKEVWQILSSTGFGGIETQTLRWACALKKRNIRSRVVLMDGGPDHPMVAGLHDLGIQVDFPETGFLNLMRHIHIGQPALIHTRGYKAGIMGRIICRILGLPVVSHFHNGEPGVGRLRLYSWLDDHTAFLAPAMAVSQKIADRLPGSAKVVDNFVEAAPKIHKRFSGNIAFVGRLSWEKGADLFCELARKFPEADFDIYGDGPERQTLETQYGDKNICFHGAVTDMPLRWADISLLVMPSRHEGLPNAALEAMANGVPVAAFDVGALSRLVDMGRNGWLVPAGDELALQGAVAEWLSMSRVTKAQMGRQARQHIETHFSATKAVPEILGVYQEAMG